MASEKKGTRLIAWGAILSLVGAIAVILSGYGYQWGWWHFSVGFKIIPWGTGMTIIGGIMALIGYIRFEERIKNYSIAAFVGMTLSLGALINIGYWYAEVQKGYPPIHDISTNTLNPPQFEAVVPLRADAPNSLEYDHSETPPAQKAFYPDIETLMVSMSYDETYDRALATARKMPWEIVGENKKEGRIEAYEKLPWFGFIDDVVIKVDTTDSGSKIDMRSVSRLGRGDLGVNAKRIRAYFKRFEK